MKIPKPYFIRYSITDLSEGTALNRPNMIELRRKIDIIIIDDEDLLVEDRLSASGFHITHKADIDSVRDVESYSIILCDIRGVGTRFDSPKEGAFLIREIKNLYPNKQLVAYTGSKFDPTYNEYLKCADAIVDKGISLDDWVSLLDDQIRKAINPQFQWQRLRQYLLDANVTTIDVAKIEDRYVQAIQKKDFSNLTSLANTSNDAAKTAISDFISSVCVKLILGGL